MSAEFPKMVYKDGHAPKVVHSQKQQDEAEGFSETPVPAEPSAADKGATFARGMSNPTKEEKGAKVLVKATAVSGADPELGADPVKGIK